MDVPAAALSAADPFRAVDTALKLDEEVIQILASVQPDGDIFVVGAGKAGASMAVAVETALGDRVTGGLVIVKDGISRHGWRTPSPHYVARSR